MRRMLLGVLVAGASPAGAESMVLPRLSQTAAAVSLGEGAFFDLKGLDALGVNPAGLAGGERAVHTQYQQLPSEASAASAAFSLPLKAFRSTLAISYVSLRSGDMERRDDAGALSGRFSQEDRQVGLHLGRSLGSVWVGGAVKGIRSRIDGYSGSSVSYDAGVRWEARGVAVGAAVMNLGRGPVLVNRASALPRSVGASASYGVVKNLRVSAGAVSYVKDHRTMTSAGVQYDLGSALTLRGGYALAARAGGGLGNGLAGGMGLRFGTAGLDYAFRPFDDGLTGVGGSGAQLATLTVRF